MNIVIAGDGEVGFHLAKMLTELNHNIVVVDPHQELLKMLENNIDLMAITGDSTSISVLEEAGIAKADLLISVVHDEKTNIVTCILGKKMGAKYTIARVNNVEYLGERNRAIFRGLGLDELIAPERIAADEIFDLLKQNAATEVYEFGGGVLELFLMRLQDNAPVIGKSIAELSKEYHEINFRAVGIHRKGKTIIPSEDSVFELNDLVYIVSVPKGKEEVFRLSGTEKVNIKKLMIIGGGRVGRKTAALLAKDASVKIIEMDKHRCEEIANSIKDVLIVNGDGRDMQVLMDEDISEMDALIAVTEDSETNILTCLLAKRFGVKRVIPLIENIGFIDIAQNIGIDTAINKKLITASYITRFTMTAEVASFRFLTGVEADVFEFLVREKAPATKKVIRQLHVPNGAMIGGIIRQGKGHVAVGDFQIQPGDKVVVFSLPSAFWEVEKLFNR
ncbi:MAG: Trk system potassium transporter TrkA [Bacteroidales bacterium]|nr:Trk system potassium transporter TrkA [Bacteroidales bacterium]